MRKRLIGLFLFASLVSLGQSETTELQKVLRVNILSPGIEYEMPISEKATIAANAGVGMNYSYTNSRSPMGDSGFTYFISPFMDVSYKNIYNRAKRERKSKNLAYNSGNYWGMRFLTKFDEFEYNADDREDNIDFSFGPTWGIQRTYGKMHLLFDVGPIYCFDTKGNSVLFPIMIQLNIGFNVN